jgi:hypothetical protein
MRTSKSYVITLDATSVVDMEKLSSIKDAVRVMNRITTRKQRVVLRGRKPIVKKIIGNFWTGKFGTRGYDWAGNIVGGIGNATKLDVYIYDRS